VRKRFQNSIYGRFGDVGSLVDLFQRLGLVFSLQQFEDIQSLGKHGDEIESGWAGSGLAVSHMN
jgi:hypothetical protein